MAVSVTLSGAGVVGCGSGSATKHANTPVTITVGMNSGEISDAEVKHFNSTHKDVKIQMVDISATGKIQAMLASGNAPDIIRTSGVNDLPTYVEEGIALDLQPYFDKSKNVFPTADMVPANNLFRFDPKTQTQGKGDMYGFLKDWSPDFMMFYNKKLFKAAGIPYPSATKPMTWQQVMADAKKLTIVKNNKIVQFGLGMDEGPCYTEPEYNMIAQQLGSENGGSLWSADKKKADFENPKVQSLISMWITAQKGNYGPNSINKDADGFSTRFTNNQEAIGILGYWFLGSLSGLKPAQQADYGAAPAPIMAGGKQFDPPSGATGAIIYSKTKHPQQAWEVFEYLFGKNGMPEKDRAESGWGVPSFKSNFKLMPSKTPLERQARAVAQEEMQTTKGYLSEDPYAGQTAVDAILSKDLQGAEAGKESVAAATKKIDSDLDEQIQSTLETVG